MQGHPNKNYKDISPWRPTLTFRKDCFTQGVEAVPLHSDVFTTLKQFIMFIPSFIIDI